MRKYVIIMGLITCANIVHAGDDTSKRARIDLSSKNRSLQRAEFDEWFLTTLSPTEKTIFLAKKRELQKQGNISTPPANKAVRQEVSTVVQARQGMISLQDDMKRCPVKYSSSASVLTQEELDAIETFRSQPEIDLSTIFIPERPRQFFGKQYTWAPESSLLPIAQEVLVQSSTTWSGAPTGIIAQPHKYSTLIPQKHLHATQQNSAHAPQAPLPLTIPAAQDENDDDASLLLAIQMSLQSK